MADVEIYSSMLCGFCHSAKRLLKSKQVDFTEIDVMFHPAQKDEMIRRAGGSTSVPQIFINGSHIGGCDDLYALDTNGALDGMLATASGAT